MQSIQEQLIPNFYVTTPILKVKLWVLEFMSDDVLVEHVWHLLVVVLQFYITSWAYQEKIHLRNSSFIQDHVRQASLRHCKISIQYMYSWSIHFFSLLHTSWIFAIYMIYRPIQGKDLWEKPPYHHIGWCHMIRSIQTYL